MKYSRVNNCLKFYDNGNGSVTAIDILSGRKYEMDAKIARLLQEIDGRRPLSYYLSMDEEECNEIENELLDMGLLRMSRIEMDIPVSIRVALWMGTGTSEANWKSLATWIHKILRITWMPVFLAGIVSGISFYSKELGLENHSSIMMLIGYFAGLVFGILLHELSHAVSGVEYGAPIYEIGVGLFLFFPFGYVLLEESAIHGRIEKVQMALAGIKMNFLIAGCALILMCCIPDFEDFFLQFSFINILLGISNLCVFGILDGNAALKAFLGVPSEWSLTQQLQIVLGIKKVHSARRINSQVMRIVILLLAIFDSCMVFLIAYEALSIWYCMFR